MKKFIIRLLLFFLPIIISLISAEFLLRSIPNDYAYKSIFLEKNADKIEVLILGNSHVCYGINPEYFKLNTFNNAHGSQTIDYDNNIFQKYFNKLSKLKYLILPIDYFTLFIRFEDGWEEYRKKYYNIYYGMHFGSTPDNYFEILHNKFSLNVKSVWLYYVKKKKLRNCINNGSATFNQEKKSGFLDNGKYRAAIQTSKTNKNITSSIDYLNKIITAANSKNIRVLLLTMPAHDSYLKYLNRSQLETTVHIAETMTHTHTGVKYYNFLSDRLFEGDDFFDSDHLNEKGAKKLSTKLDSIINHF